MRRRARIQGGRRVERKTVIPYEPRDAKAWLQATRSEGTDLSMVPQEEPAPSSQLLASGTVRP